MIFTTIYLATAMANLIVYVIRRNKPRSYWFIVNSILWFIVTYVHYINQPA